MHIQNLLIDAFLLFATILDFGLALLILFRGKKNESNLSYSFFSIWVGLWTLGILMFRVTGNIKLAYFWNQEFIFTAGLIASTFVQFTYSFLEKPLSLKSKMLLHFPNALILACLLIPGLLIKEIVIQDWGKESILGNLYWLYGLYFSSYMVFAFYKLIMELRTARGIYRQKIKYILVGITTSCVVGAYFNLLLILMGNYRYIWVGPYCSFIMVLIIGYSIGKYHLLDINIIIRRGLALLLISILAWGCVMWIELTNIPVQAKMILYGIIIVGLVSSLPALIRKFESMVTQIFYKDKYIYQDKLRAVARAIPSIYDMEKLLKTLDSISKAIDCSPCSFMLLDNITKKYSISHSIGLNEKIKKDLSFSPEKEFIQKLKWGGRPIVKEELLEDDLARERMDLIKAEVSVPIMRKDSLLGILNLHHKASGDIYSSEDLSVLTDIAEFLGMAIENITLKNKEHHEEIITYLNNIAYAMSHELKNKSQAVLTTAVGILDMLPSITNVPPDLIKLAQMSKEKITEIDKIVNEMLTYSNIQQREGFGELDLAKTLDDSLRVTAGEIEAKKIKIIKDYKEAKISHGDWGQIIQAFVNVIKNGIESMEQNGSLNLKISDKDKLWEVSITDAGKGIPKNHLNSIFEPFFTTKSENTGLGLSIARRIVYDHAGDIKAESEEGKGTTINIYFPKQMPEEKIKARAEIKRREDIAYDRIKTKDAQDKLKKENNNNG